MIKAIKIDEIRDWEKFTCALNAWLNNSANVNANFSDFPVSDAYKIVALILLERAKPNKLDVNLTALCLQTKHSFKYLPLPPSRTLVYMQISEGTCFSFANN